MSLVSYGRLKSTTILVCYLHHPVCYIRLKLRIISLFQSIVAPFRMTRITRSSTYGPLGLPIELACRHCKSSIAKSKITGKPACMIKKCICPFDEKWANHREQNKVDLHIAVLQYLTHKFGDDINIGLDDDDEISNSDNDSNFSLELLPTPPSPIPPSQTPPSDLYHIIINVVNIINIVNIIINNYYY